MLAYKCIHSVIWEICRERNNRIFKKEGRPIQQVMMEGIYDKAKAWAYAGNRGLQQVLPRQILQVVGLDDGHVHQLVMLMMKLLFTLNVNQPCVKLGVAWGSDC